MAITPGDSAIFIKNILFNAVKPVAGDTALLVNGKVIKGVAPNAGDTALAYPDGKGGWIVIKTESYTLLFVSDTGNTRLMRRNRDDLSYLSKYSVSDSPTAICSDGVFIYSIEGSTLYKRRPGDFSVAASIGTLGTGDDQFSTPAGIYHNSGYLYISDTGNNRIVKRSASDLSYISKIGSFGSGNDQFNSMGGICATSDYVYVADYNNMRIVKRAASDLSFVTSFPSVPGGVYWYPLSLCTDGTYLYASVVGTNTRLYRFRLSDNYAEITYGSYGTGTNQFRVPRGLSTDGEYVFVADSTNNRIVKLTCDLTWDSVIGSSGTGDDQFNDPWGTSVL